MKQEKKGTRMEAKRKREKLMGTVFLASIAVWAIFTALVVWWVC